MDTNGYNSFNNFSGPVFVDGDVDIDGNLDVTGTINGGGGGTVNNPMTVDLDANQFAILNVSEIAGFAGVL
jgi:cytoskeletal protein CcmA (bactofilin family)